MWAELMGQTNPEARNSGKPLLHLGRRSQEQESVLMEPRGGTALQKGKGHSYHERYSTAQARSRREALALLSSCLKAPAGVPPIGGARATQVIQSSEDHVSGHKARETRAENIPG